MRYLLILLNIICAAIHLLFGIYIYDKPYEYAGFISIENTLIIFVYLTLSLLIFTRSKKEGVLLNLFFWSVFEVCVLFFRPLKTTLEVFDLKFPTTQWHLLAIMGGIVILLNCVILLCKKTSNYCE